jgi:hypothetical protein
VVVDPFASTVSAPRVLRRAPELLGTDVGEPRTAPPPTDDVPWPAGEPVEATPKPPPQAESLDPDVPPARAGQASSAAAGQHPMWSADPFTPTPAHLEEPQTVSAEEVGLVEAAPEPVAAKTPPSPPIDDSGEHAHALEPRRARAPSLEAAPDELSAAEAAAASHGDFSFAGLLNEAHGAPPPQEEPRPPQSQDYPDTTAPGEPSDALLARARGEEPAAAPEPYPGDEPTRIEPVSAALLDKLRERDEELSDQAAAAAQQAEAPAAPAQQGWGPLVPEGDALDRATASAAAAMDPPAPAPEANVTMSDFSMPAVETADPDEQHWRETYDKFRELKTQLGEQSDKIGFEKFATKLRKNRADLIAKHNCKGVRFSVYEKDGKAAIKASAIR